MIKHGKMEQLQTKTTGRSFQDGRHRKQSQKRTGVKMKQGNNDKAGRHHIVSCMARWVFMGHDESCTFLNKGNFLELVQLVAKYDSNIKMHLDDINHIQSQQKKTYITVVL